MATISLYYWAGAKAAAGVDVERFEADSVAQALQHARDQRADPRFDQVLSVSSVLVDGVVARGEALDRPVTEAVRVEILPPFAGGSARSAAS
jgi:molybdopterin synthase sulfur carrier subunit